MNGGSGVFDLVDEIVAAGGRLILDEFGTLRCQARADLIPDWVERIRRSKDRLVAMLNGDALSQALMQSHNLDPIDLEAAQVFAETIGVTSADAMAFRSELVAALDGAGVVVTRLLAVEIEAYRQLTKWLRQRQELSLAA